MSTVSIDLVGSGVNIPYSLNTIQVSNSIYTTSVKDINNNIINIHTSSDELVIEEVISTILIKTTVYEDINHTLVNNHSLQINLNADDHPQYFNTTRGDIRYYTKTQVDGFNTTLQNSLDLKSDLSHVHNYQPLSSILTNTTSPFTVEKSDKLNSIAVGAEVNINADWESTSGDSLILNKPILGSFAQLSSISLDTVTEGILYKRVPSTYYTDLTDSGDATIHYHVSDRLRSNHSGTQLLSTIEGVTISVSDLNSLDDNSNSTLHYHLTDRARANHTGTQTADTISDQMRFSQLLAFAARHG